MKMGTLDKIEKFELKHNVSSFILTVLITIIITRIIVKIKDVNPIIGGYELHHFYYGIILLMIVVILMIFGEKHPMRYPLFAGIAIGLILDEFLFVLGGMTAAQYSKTLPSAIIFFLVVIIIVEIVYRMNKNNGKAKNHRRYS